MVMMRLRVRIASGLLLPVVIAGMVGACSVTQSNQSTEASRIVQPVWPEPPLEPRIKFLTALASERDLGRETTFADTVSAFLTGDKPPADHLVQPMDIAVSEDGGRIYVSDFGTQSVYLLNRDSKEMIQIGGEQRTWSYPFGIALDDQENLYVVEQETKIISVFDRSGRIVRQFTDPSLERPTDIEVDEERGVIYVVDGSHQKSSNHYVKVFDEEGHFLRNIGKGKGTGDGYLMFPTYLAIGDEGRLYVTDTVNSRVCIFEPDGTFVRQIGERGNGFGMFDKPKGVALDSFGNIYVVDSGWSNVQIFNQEGTVLLYFGGRGAFPGLLRNPTGLTIDDDDRIYVADYLNNRLDIYQLINTTAEDSFIELPEDEADAE